VCISLFFRSLFSFSRPSLVPLSSLSLSLLSLSCLCCAYLCSISISITSYLCLCFCLCIYVCESLCVFLVSFSQWVCPSGRLSLGLSVRMSLVISFLNNLSPCSHMTIALLCSMLFSTASHLIHTRTFISLHCTITSHVTSHFTPHVDHPPSSRTCFSLTLHRFTHTHTLSLSLSLSLSPFRPKCDG
jgi:hypothetical protein